MSTTTTGFATELITFSRGSLATVTDADGKIKWAPHNLLTHSEQFDGSGWASPGLLAFGSGSSANALAAPNGTTTADYIRENSSASRHFVFAIAATTSGSSYTAGVYVKAGEKTFGAVGLRTTDGVTGYVVVVNLSTGAITTTSSTGTPTGTTSSITAVGSGWYLVTVSMIATTANVYVEIGASDSGTPTFAAGMPTYTGTGTSGIYLWGAHLYRSDLGGMQANASAYPMYNPSTPRNLLGWSEDFSNATWNAVTNATVSTNAGAAPNGSQTADLIYPASSGSNRQRYQAVTGQTSGTRYTVSIYLKSSSMQWVAMLSPNGANFGCYFDLVNGVKGTEASGVTGSITSLGDGWYRCSVSQVSSATTIYCGISFADANGGTSVTASGTSGVLAWGAQLSDSASLDPYVGSYGPPPSAAAAHGPRLDYDPVTLAARGLLVEETRTNLLTYSDAFDNAAWGKFNLAATPVIANAFASPSGAQTADKIVEDNSSLGHNIRQASITITSGINYTFSVYARAAERTQILLELQGFTASSFAYFNLSTGAAFSPGAGIVGTPTMTPVGNGWYRCSITATSNSTSGTAIIYTAVAGSVTYAGDNTSGVYIWGAQLEAGSFATSYIPTANNLSGVKREADVASVATSQFPYSQTSGTLVINFQYTLAASNVDQFNRTIASLAGANPTADRLYFYNKDGKSSALVQVGGAQQANITVSGVQPANTPLKTGLAYAANDFAFSQDGAAPGTASSGSLPTVTTLFIGCASSTTVAPLNGHIRQITYIPRRLANADLQARTV